MYHIILVVGYLARFTNFYKKITAKRLRFLDILHCPTGTFHSELKNACMLMIAAAPDQLNQCYETMDKVLYKVFYNRHNL